MRGGPAGGETGRSGAGSASVAGCSTMAITRLAMKRAVRTTCPVRVTSATSTMPRPVKVSRRRPARRATIWNSRT